MGGVTAISAGLTAQAMRCMGSELDITAPRLFSPSNPSDVRPERQKHFGYRV